MGARPAWALLALTLPQADEAWLAEFAAGFGGLARASRRGARRRRHHTGPLCVTVQAPRARAAAGSALRRSGARAGDALFVSGTPGDAAAGLALEQGAPARHRRGARLPARALPAAQRRASRSASACASYASACIDVSDGLLGDAGKLARASGVRLRSWTTPRCRFRRHCADAVGEERARLLALTGGDDYELCFTVPPRNAGASGGRAAAGSAGVTRASAALRRGRRCGVTRDGTVMEFSHSGYRAFRLVLSRLARHATSACPDRVRVASQSRRCRRRILRRRIA